MGETVLHLTELPNYNPSAMWTRKPRVNGNSCISQLCNKSASRSVRPLKTKESEGIHSYPTLLEFRNGNT
jgi:hypothetical protein